MTAPARRLALDAYAEVLADRRFLDDALARRADAFGALPPRDRGFVRALLLGAFRRRGDIDAALGARLERAPPEHARRILELGVAELLCLDTPPYAAVDAAVSLMKERQPRLAGLANAVLRRIATEWSPPVEDAARRNTPDWLWERLVADWGAERAGAIASAELTPAALDVTPKAPRGAAALAEALGGAMLAGGSIRLTPRGDPSGLAGYAEGAWWVQDAAAALPARLLDLRPDERALDLCAAPGGKTMQLAATGAQVTAVDVSEWRLRRVDDNLRRTGLTAELVRADALSWRPERRIPAVLLDAPCSATGTIRRHPEALWIKSAAGLGDLVALQDRLLDAAWEMVAPGGRLVFCTCSLFRAEGEERAQAFLARTPDAAVRPTPAADPALAPFAAPDGGFRTTPAETPDRLADGAAADAVATMSGMDGFFAVRFDKR